MGNVVRPRSSGLHRRRTARASRIQFNGEMVEVCFNDRLYAKYGDSPPTLQQIFDNGFNMLSKPHKSDDVCYRRRRVQSDVLIVQDRYGIMFIEPSDWQVKLKPRASRTGLFKLVLAFIAFQKKTRSGANTGVYNVF